MERRKFLRKWYRPYNPKRKPASPLAPVGMLDVVSYSGVTLCKPDTVFGKGNPKNRCDCRGCIAARKLSEYQAVTQTPVWFAPRNPDYPKIVSPVKVVTRTMRSIALSSL